MRHRKPSWSVTASTGAALIRLIIKLPVLYTINLLIFIAFCISPGILPGAAAPLGHLPQIVSDQAAVGVADYEFIKKSIWLCRIILMFIVLLRVRLIVYDCKPSSYPHLLTGADVRPRQLRSSDSVTCAVRRTRTTYGNRCFAVAGPRVWNSLPTELRQSDSLEEFKRRLKTH